MALLNHDFRIIRSLNSPAIFAPPPAGGGGDADSDFLFRRRSPGVIRYFDYDQNAGNFDGGFGDNYGVIPGTNGSPVLDTSVKASGAGSMRFDILPAGGTNNANWFTNFSDDLSILFGENTEFYVQWKQRISQTALEDWGHKYTIIGTGDDPGWNSSCTDLEIELDTRANTVGVSPENQFPTMYNACPGMCGGTFPFEEEFNGSDFKLQNAIPDPYCRYQDPTKANCLRSVADQWMVFQIGVNVGPRIISGGHYFFSGSRVRCWMQQSPNSPEILIHDWLTGTTPGSAVGLCAGDGAVGNQRYGKLWFLTYTQQSVASPRPASVWYDELIISQQKIPAAQA